MDVNQFWKQFEKEVSSVQDTMSLIHDVFEYWSAQGATFAWRGQVNATWPLHSLLYRRLLWSAKSGQEAPDEERLRKEENELLAELRRWGLHVGERGRLSVLGQLAMLQHYGAPTRLIDVTLNPLVGLWFAVEEQWDNGLPQNDDKDGRLFAIDVSRRLINEQEDLRSWEDERDSPWPEATNQTGIEFNDWTGKVLAWKPPRLDPRIAAQNGAFLLGGVPCTPAQWQKKPGVWWKTDEVRRALSIPLKLHKIDSARGRPPDNPTYTIRIKYTAKAEIRKHLQELYGYRHSTIYPDYQGFALYGRPGLRTRP